MPAESYRFSFDDEIDHGPCRGRSRAAAGAPFFFFFFVITLISSFFLLGLRSVRGRRAWLRARAQAHLHSLLAADLPSRGRGDRAVRDVGLLSPGGGSTAAAVAVFVFFFVVFVRGATAGTREPLFFLLFAPAPRLAPAPRGVFQRSSVAFLRPHPEKALRPSSLLLPLSPLLLRLSPQLLRLLARPTATNSSGRLPSQSPPLLFRRRTSSPGPGFPSSTRGATREGSCS